MTATVERLAALRRATSPRPHAALYRPYAHRKPVPDVNLRPGETVTYTADCPCGEGPVVWVVTRMHHPPGPMGERDAPPVYEIDCTARTETTEETP